jgi:MinD-like ATPase involved in chromosome partitioning or flagellar assembly
MKPFWVSFYSYKGGVGRSMALANLAALLARRGRRVFMIDFDLEAPGLDSFQEFGIEARKQGVVEYAHEFQQKKIAPELSAYVQECKFSRPVRGNVWLMSSGKKDESYNAKRISVNWEELYASGLGEPFIANWKAAIHRLYKPDYVFVDSRTGLTDVGGICTLHLPDLVVLLFGLNDQNLHGTAAVLQTIRNAPAARPPQVLTVATPVPNLPQEEDGLLKNRLAEAEKQLGIKVENTITYNPQAALIEKLFTLDHERNRTASEYRYLCEEIQKRDLDGLDSLIRKADEACEEDNQEAAIRIRVVLSEDYGDRADALFTIGQITRSFGERDEAVAAWRKALELEPSHPEAFRAMVGYAKQKKQFDEVIRLFDARLEHVAKVNPGSVPEIHRDRAEQLMAMHRYAEAALSYRAALIEMDSDDADEVIGGLFNEAEAERRATGKIDREKWRAVIGVFEGGIRVEARPLAIQANMLQAIHIPYACLGKTLIALDFLERAQRCGVAVGKTEPIFCVKTYTYLTAEEFLPVNEEMIAALKAGKLWDGMGLQSES